MATSKNQQPNLRDDIILLRDHLIGSRGPAVDAAYRICQALEKSLNGGSIVGEIRIEFRGFKIPISTLDSFPCSHEEATMDCLDEPKNLWQIRCDTCGQARSFIFQEVTIADSH